MPTTTNHPRPRRQYQHRHAMHVILAALGVFLLAWLQPVSYEDADGGLTLVAAQALVEHGSADLAVYRDHPDLAYDLDDDYRVRTEGAQLRLYNVGMPILSVPAVLVARNLGFDMVNVDHEYALQNLLSALCMALLVVLLTATARVALDPTPSLVLALVTLLGSPFISTGATALWSLDYAVLFMVIGLREILMVEHDRRSTVRWSVVVTVLALAYLCRPATGFMMLGVVAWQVARLPIRARVAVLLAALTGLVAAFAVPDGVLPPYYDPDRLRSTTPLGLGLGGVLLSPSRGLLVYCPVLLVVMAGTLRAGPSLWRRPIIRLALAWSLPHIVLVATRSMWWGGHSFGPRMLAELVLPAFAIAVSLASYRWWRAPAWRTAAVVLATASVTIHTGAGLFNEQTKAWNHRPNIDWAQFLLFDWRTPQFLAHEDALVRRERQWQRHRMTPLSIGDLLRPEERQGVFVGFGAPEGALRWTVDSAASIEFAASGVRADAWYELILTAGTHGRQTVQAWLGDRALETWTHDGSRPCERRWLVAGHTLLASTPTVLRFALPDARPDIRPDIRPTDADPRPLGMAFHGLTLQALPTPRDHVNFAEDRWFRAGFGDAEAGWRWSNARRATVVVPIHVRSDIAYRLTVEGHTVGRQRVIAHVRSPGDDLREVGTWVLDAGTIEVRHGQVPPGTLRVGAPVIVDLALPDAHPTDTDVRLLGLALRTLRLEPVRHSAPETDSDGPTSKQRYPER